MTDTDTQSSGPPPVDPEVKEEKSYGKRLAESMEAQIRMSIKESKHVEKDDE